MARPLRVEFEDAIYDLCSRGNAWQRIFWYDHDRSRFMELLAESSRRFDVAIFCSVLIRIMSQLRKEMLNIEI